ncbi:CDP-alcohol phosphatidyltransferase family protein [Candidatus Marinimicrobia bacterium MT.SAG.3]|nr:CDP-alcohol phosphatidyltransferase family protein [Candidatus Marinimicrobia bacterium MT.SAG.3]
MKNKIEIPEEYNDKIYKEGFNPIPPFLVKGYLRIILPLTDFFRSLNINPNTLTTLGTIFTIVGAIFFALSYLRLGGIFIVLGAVCDTMDGKIARDSDKKSNYGAFYDSVMDRYSEIIMFFGIAVHFVRHDSYWTSVAIFAAVGGSVMVSYVRARAEGLGFECKVGLMQRPERIAYISVGAIIGELPLIKELFLMLAIWVIAILSNFTAIQRIIHVYKLAKEMAKNETVKVDK